MKSTTQSQTVPIDQIICTIQGEGSNIGTPSLLIRTKGCNLSCPFCDSKRTWQIKSDDLLLSIKNLIVLEKQIVDVVRNNLNYNIHSLILSGGEPSIHFDNIVYRNFIGRLCESLDIDVVEIETNAAFIPFKNIENFIESLSTRINDRIIFNISPKDKSDIEIVKQNIIWCYDHKESQKIDFVLKIVNAKSSIEQFEQELVPIISPLENVKIYIMPLTPYNSNNSIDKEQYIKNCQDTVRYCLKTGYKYCPREHIWIFGQNVDEHLKIF